MRSTRMNVDGGVRGIRGLMSVTTITLAAVVGLLATGSPVNRAWADPVPTVRLGGMQEGQVTAVGLTYLEVEGRSYRLDPKVTIQNEAEQSMELKQLQQGMGVQFGLKEGAMYKIIVIMPR